MKPMLLVVVLALGCGGSKGSAPRQQTSTGTVTNGAPMERIDTMDRVDTERRDAGSMPPITTPPDLGTVKSGTR